MRVLLVVNMLQDHLANIRCLGKALPERQPLKPFFNGL